MGDPEKTNDDAPTGDTGAGLRDASAETVEPQSTAPAESAEPQSLESGASVEAVEPRPAEQSGGEQSVPAPGAETEHKAAEPQSAESPVGTQSPPAKVRYQVLAPVFVNGSLIDPKGSKNVYVFATPGLDGRALKLAPEATPG